MPNLVKKFRFEAGFLGGGTHLELKITSRKIGLKRSDPTLNLSNKLDFLI